MRIIGASPRRNRWIVLGVVLWLTRSAMAQYVDLSAQIEVNVWNTQPGTPSEFQDSRAQLRPITVHCVVNSNTWVMDDDFVSESARTTHWFTGTNIVKYDLVNGTSPLAQSRVTASNDGNPGRGTNQSDQLTMVARIAWLAFCSGPCLKREGREIFPPSDLWKDLLTVKRFLDETVTFDDSLGLPKVMNLTTGNGQPIFQYRTVSSTNVSGWEFPLEFKVAQYRPVHGFPRPATETNGWQLEFTATGKVTAIMPTSPPTLPQLTIGTNGWGLRWKSAWFRTAKRELWDEVVGTAVKRDAGGYSASFGDVCTVSIALDRPYKILARRLRGWPFVLEYKLNAPDGESTLSISLDTSDFRSSDEVVSKSPGFSGIERRKIRVGPQEVVFREWSDSGAHNSDASTRLEAAADLPVVIRIKAHAKDRKKALEDALQSIRLEGRSEPFPPNQSL